MKMFRQSEREMCSKKKDKQALNDKLRFGTTDFRLFSDVILLHPFPSVAFHINQVVNIS